MNIEPNDFASVRKVLLGDPANHLVRPGLEERHVSFFADILSFNDLRRTKKDPATLQVPVPINTGSNHPERFLYPFDEENTNGTNVPDITNIFEKTKINQ